MVNAMIFAGGTGTRMKTSDIPKQFIEIDGKPIIIRTLENFSTHHEVDGIVISCLETWIDELWNLIEKWKVPKIVDIVRGGATGHESIHNGLVRIEQFAQPEDIVLICDGVRPVMSEELISNCIRLAKKYETAVPVTPSIDSVLWSDDGEHCSRALPRNSMYITQAPQGYTMRKIMGAHLEAERRGIVSPTSSSELLIELGQEIHIYMGERDNIKITTPEDLVTLRSHYYYDRYKSFAREELKYGLE